jgi:formate dehydrogenase major subunit
MLRKKASGVARGPQSASFVGKIAEKAVDRRAFLKGSGLAIGGVAAASAFVGTNIKPAQAVMASGQVRSQDGTARLTLVHIVPKGLLCVKLQVASAV